MTVPDWEEIMEIIDQEEALEKEMEKEEQKSITEEYF